MTVVDMSRRLLAARHAAASPAGEPLLGRTSAVAGPVGPALLEGEPVSGGPS